MKKAFFCSILLLIQQIMYACPVCERANKNKLFGKIGHAAQPASNFDYIWVWIMIIITLYTLYYSIKYLIKPN
ncbi:MAG: hypothetical protein ORN58_06860, partial [Sediminibacterium sp.]|nr:hypothetical protein [Sediminibacterium sp.]